MKSSEKPKVALIDADFFVYRISFADKDAEDRDAKNRLTEWFTDIVYINLQCDTYKAWITGKNNFRYDVAKTVPYKGNRKDLEKPPHYELLREHLVKRLGAKVTDGEEADDAVAIASTNEYGWIVHVDKDLDQLPGWHYNPVKDEQYYVTEFEGLKSFYKQLLTGDRIDNVEGIKGIGPVKANKLLQSCKTEQELYEAVWQAYQKHGLNLDRLKENGQLLWLRRQENQMWLPPST